jgi:hypothetical protein
LKPAKNRKIEGDSHPKNQLYLPKITLNNIRERYNTFRKKMKKIFNTFRMAQLISDKIAIL